MVLLLLVQVVVVVTAPVILITPFDPAVPPLQLPENIRLLPVVICGLAWEIVRVGPAVLRIQVPVRTVALPA